MNFKQNYILNMHKKAYLVIIYPIYPHIQEKCHFCHIQLKGRVQSQMVFFLVLYLETSFLAYMCILGQLKKKILAAILEKNMSNRSARARASKAVTLSKSCFRNRGECSPFITILSRTHFFCFSKK